MYSMITTLAGALALSGLFAVTHQHQGVDEPVPEGLPAFAEVGQSSQHEAGAPRLNESGAGGADPADQGSRLVAFAIAAGEYLPEADLNGDGFINVLDLVIESGEVAAGVIGDRGGFAEFPLVATVTSEGRRAILDLRSADAAGFEAVSYTLSGTFVRGETVGATPRVLSVEPRVERDSGGQVLRSLGPDSFTVTHKGVAADPQPVHVTVTLDLGEAPLGRYELVHSEDSVAIDAGWGLARFVQPVVTLMIRSALDLDGSGVLENADLVELTGLLGSGPGRGDFDGDGAVGSDDLALLVENIGQPLIEVLPADRLSGTDGARPAPGSLHAGGGRDADAANTASLAEPGDGPLPGGMGDRPDGAGGSGTIGAVIGDKEPVIGKGSAAPRVISISPPPEAWVVDGMGISSFEIAFDRDVVVPQGSAQLWASEASSYTPVTASYDAFSRTLTVTPGVQLTDERYTLVIDYGVVGTDGLPLDGEVISPRDPVLPSGDGSPGGEAVFQYTVLRGDVTRDGVVDQADRQALSASLGLSAGDPGFDPDADLNGDSFVNALDIAVLSTSLGNALPAVMTPVPRITSRTPSPGETYVATGLDTVLVNFEYPIKVCSIRPTAIYAVHPDGGIQSAECSIPTASNAAIIFGFEPPLPAGDAYELRLSNALTDLSGQTLPLDGGERWATTVEEPPPPRTTDSAVVLGRVIDITTGAPLHGAYVSHYIAEGYTEQTPPLPGSVFTNPDGEFQLTTVPFEGMERFLIRITKQNHTESLRIVEIMADRCERVEDASLNPTNESVTVGPNDTMDTTLEDTMGDDVVELLIPAGAVGATSEISLTILESADAIRDDLPQFVMPQGVFIDISGVFGDETTEPVTLKLPNTHNLPLGTEVRFGKISHETGEWTDLRTPFGDDEPDDPNEGIGFVEEDGLGGTCIRVRFTNFCTICTPYTCSPTAPGDTDDQGDDEKSPPSCPGPGNPCGNSVINTREGFLWEELQLPAFGERGGAWGLMLGYAHHAAAPSYTITADTTYQNTRPVERTVYRFQIEGNEHFAAYDRTTSTLGPKGTYFWDGRNGLGVMMPTGSYEYEIESVALTADQEIWLSDEFGGNPSFFTGQTFPDIVPIPANPIQGRAIIVNQSQSEFGAGWTIMNESRLHFDPDGCIVLVFGNNEYRLFVPTGDDEDIFVSPEGEFSSLARLPNGTYERSFTDGSSETYSALGRLLRRTDRYGYVSTFAYANGRLVTAVSPAGNAVNLFYDDNGHLERVVDSAGRETMFEVNQEGHLVSMTNAVGATRTFEYDAEGRLVGQGGSRGERTEYHYENTRVVAAESYDTDGATLLRRREFGPSVLQGEIGEAIDSGLGTVEFPIPAIASRVDTYTDGRGATTYYETDDRGNVTRITDALNRSIRLSYNAYDLVSRRYRPDNSYTDYFYNDNGDLTQALEGYNNASIQVEYNGPFGLPSLIRDQVQNPVSITYTAAGNVETITDAEQNTTTFFYEDPRFPDQVTGVQDPEGGVVRVEYGSSGNPEALIDPLLRRTEFAYDNRGNTRLITDARGYESTFVYDELNRTTSATDPEDNTTTLSYDEDGCGCSTGQLTRVTLPNGSSIQYDYDGLGRQTSRTDQGGRVSTVAYGPEGEPVLAIRRTGDRLRYINDPLGRVLAIVNELTGDTLSEFAYDVNGNLVTASNAVSLIEMTYDPLGRLDFERQTVFPPPAEPILPGDELTPRLPVASEIDYMYDPANRLTRREDDLGAEIYRYDTRGLVRELEFVDSDGGSLFWTLTRDGVGRRTEIAYPNGLNQSFGYDIAGQLTQIEVYNAATLDSLDKILYTSYLPSGQLESSTRIRPGEEDLSWDYGYSPAGRLISATINRLPDGVTTEDQISEYGFDGRLQSVNGREVTFDDAGRMTSIGLPSGAVRTMEWNEFNQLTSVIEGTGTLVFLESQYGYDPFGRRVFEEANGISLAHRYDGLTRVGSRSVAGPDTLREVRLLDEVDDLVAAIAAPTQMIGYAHADRVGTILLWSDPAGLLAGMIEPAPSGHILRSQNTWIGRAGISGLRIDLETGLTHARFRQLDNGSLSFLSEDPLGLSGGLNLWSYTFGDPVNYTDPYGLQACPASDNPDDDWVDDFLDSLPFIGAIRKRGDAIEDLAKAMDGPPQQLRCAVERAENAERRAGLEATAAGISLDAYNRGFGGLRRGKQYGKWGSEPTRPATRSDVEDGFGYLWHGMF